MGDCGGDVGVGLVELVGLIFGVELVVLVRVVVNVSS